MTTEELLERLRSKLQPTGSAQVVTLLLSNHGFTPVDVVQQAVDRLEYLLTIGNAMDEKANALELLGMRLLLDSIYYDWDKE